MKYTWRRSVVTLQDIIQIHKMFGTDEIEKRLRMASPSSTNGVRIASYHLLEKAAPSCQLDYTLLHHMRNAGTLSLSLGRSDEAK